MAVVLGRKGGGSGGGGGGAPTGPAGGDLSGTYPNPALSVAKQAELDGKVAKATYDANTVLAANTDNTPAAVTMGASTILARLAAGNIKAATIQEVLGLWAGSAFPGGPSSGNRFFRSDLGLEFYYDGTRWLTVNQYKAPLGRPLVNVSTNFTAGDYLLSNAGPMDMWLERLEGTVYVTSNTGSVYWTIGVSKYSPANAETSVGSFNTSADTASTNTSHSATIGAVVTVAGFPLVSLYGTKTSTPGNIYGATQIVYRLIGT